MGKINKTSALLLTIIVAMPCLTLLTVNPASAQMGVTNPAIPAFDVTLHTFPNYIPPTYGIDPSTGKAVKTKAGYTEQYVWIDVNIGGQPFVRYNNSAGQLISLNYNVRWKGNHDSSWQTGPQGIHFGDAADPWASQAIGRLITLGFKGISSGGGADGYLTLLDPTATQIDFQVEALIGYYNSNDSFVGQTSGWSNTQTLEVSIPSDAALSSPASSPISTASPTATSTVPELSWLAILPLLLSVFFLTVIIRNRKTAN